MAALGSLVVSLEANTAKFTSGMDKAAYQSQQAMNKMKRDAEMVGKAFGLMAVAGAGALVVMVKSSLNAMDSMSKLAQKTGTTVESLSALSYAADLSGVTTESLGSAIIKLSKNMSDAQQGIGDARKAFDALGISVNNSDGSLKNSGIVISELAGKFAGFRDGAEKTALAVAIFGKSGADLIPLLNNGADGIKTMTDEAARFGLVMDTQASKAAEKFNDDMTRLTKTKEAFANAVTVSVLPVLQAVADEMLLAAKESDGFSAAGNGVRTVLETFVVVGSEVAFVFKGVGTEIGGIAAQLAALGRGDFKGFTAISDAMRADAERARIEHDAFIARVLDRSAANPLTANYGSRQFGGNLGNAPRISTTSKKTGTGTGTVKDPYADANRYLDSLKKQYDRTQDLTTLEQTLKDIQTGRLGKITPAIEAELISTAKLIDAQKLLAQQTAEANAEAEDFFQRIMSTDDAKQTRINQLLSATPSANLESQRADMELLTKELEQGRISEQTYLEAVTVRLDLVAEKTDKATSLAEELGLTFTSAFEDAIVSGGDLSGVLKGLEQDIMRIVTRKLVTEPIGNFITGAIGSFLPSFAVGTDYVPRDMVAQIHKGERIVPAAQNTGKASANTVNVTINQTFAPGTTRATTLQAAADASRQLQYAGRNL